MHRNKLLPYSFYMTKAGESAADFNLSQDINNLAATGELGTDPEGDRGDDFDPALFEEEDNAARRPVPDTKEKEKNDETNTDDDKSSTDDTKNAGKTDVDNEKTKDEGRKSEKPKPSRAEKRVQQLLERNAILERQLTEKTGNAAVAATLTDLETKASQLETAYHKALAEDPEKATDLMRQIRQIDRQIAKAEATVEADAVINERLETRDLQATISDIVEKYPELDKNNDDYDADTVAEINALFQGLIATSPNKAAAMRKAVSYVMGENRTAAVGLGEDTGKDKREERKQEGAKRTVDTVNRQPASVSTAGRSNPASSVAHVRNLKDLDKLSEEELAKLRGDEV